MANVYRFLAAACGILEKIQAHHNAAYKQDIMKDYFYIYYRIF